MKTLNEKKEHKLNDYCFGLKSYGEVLRDNIILKEELLNIQYKIVVK